MKRLVSSLAAFALIAVPLAGCGGADKGAKVEASLRQYISTLTPGGPFPVGAGPPRVKHDGCKDGHVTTKKSHVYRFGDTVGQFPEGLKLWSCVVMFRRSLTLPVEVVLEGSEVVAVLPKAAPDTRPTTVYEGGPKRPQP